MNHFRYIDMVIDNAFYRLSKSFIKSLHYTLKNGTSNSRKEWFVVKDYKKLPNEISGRITVALEEITEKMHKLQLYNIAKEKTIKQIIAFHYEFESIYPFQNGHGCVGRLILFKECLKNQIIPFIIDEKYKLFYYRELHEWKNQKGYLIDTYLSAQDTFKTYLDYFRISYVCFKNILSSSQFQECCH